MDIRTIVVRVDFSGYSEKALIWALALAEKWRSHVILIHVVCVAVPTPMYPRQ
ncbi:MAG: universal stress protein [Thermodesulfobacteriota bacterium]